MLGRRKRRQSIVDGATYNEWVTFFDDFAKGELSAVPVTAPLPEAIGADAVIRLSNRAIESMHARLDLWSKQLDRNFEHQRSVLEFERILARSRDQIATVWEFVHTAELPDAIRQNLQAQVKDVIEKTQENLQRQFDDDPQKRTEYGLAVRRASLLAVMRGEVATSTSRAVDNSSPSGRSRRQILVDREKQPNAE